MKIGRTPPLILTVKDDRLRGGLIATRNRLAEFAMALSPLHKCNHNGCNKLVRTPRCNMHAKEKRQPDTLRPNSYQRGYDKNWRALRDAYLAENPLCHDCQEQGHTKAAREVHHKHKVAEHPELRLDWDNLMSLCTECHSRRTARGE